MRSSAPRAEEARIWQAGRLGGTRARLGAWLGKASALRYALGVYLPLRLVCSAIAATTRALIPLDVTAGRPYLALFPTAFFLLAAYAESLFLLCVVAAFYHARRGEWVRAGAWGFFVPLARLPGAAILLPLGWEFVRQRWARRARGERLQWQRAWPLGLVVLGGLAFPLYAHLALGADSLLAPYTIYTQRFMGRFAWPWQSLWSAVRVLAGGQFRVIEPFDLTFAVLFIALTVAAWRTLPRIYGSYMAAMLGGSLTKVSEVQPLLSLSRYVLVLFPGFVVLTQWSRDRPWAQRAGVYTSRALALFFVGQFAIWGWVG